MKVEAQKYPWSSKQITIHHFVIHFKNETEVKHLNSEHNPNAVYTSSKEPIIVAKFQKDISFFRWFCCTVQNLQKILNLMLLQRRLTVTKWYFSITAYRKGPPDGVDEQLMLVYKDFTKTKFSFLFNFTNRL